MNFILISGVFICRYARMDHLIFLRPLCMLLAFIRNSSTSFHIRLENRLLIRKFSCPLFPYPRLATCQYEYFDHFKFLVHCWINFEGCIYQQCLKWNWSERNLDIFFDQCIRDTIITHLEGAVSLKKIFFIWDQQYDGIDV